MELFDASWWTALATIIVIDLILAGDNALVIGMAAGRLRAWPRDACAPTCAAARSSGAAPAR